MSEPRAIPIGRKPERLEIGGDCRYISLMIKALENAIAKVRTLTEEKQRLAAEILEELAASGETYVLSEEEHAAIREALDQANSGEFASDEEVNDLLRRRWD